MPARGTFVDADTITRVHVILRSRSRVGPRAESRASIGSPSRGPYRAVRYRQLVDYLALVTDLTTY